MEFPLILKCYFSKGSAESEIGELNVPDATDWTSNNRMWRALLLAVAT
jgi:hypothetical protein